MPGSPLSRRREVGFDPAEPRPRLEGRLGTYELLEVVGYGNMGTVYRARDPTLRREVAIKICSISRLRTEPERRMYRRLFLNEARTAGALSHPNILTVYDVGEHRDVPYIVMEYLPSAETLDTYCRPDSRLPVARVLETVYQCAKALDYAHRRGVVHRDIKPSNVLLTATGNVKIGDFGIAQHAHSDTTQVLGMVGSPKYMSPEQAREEDLTGQSDLYSLGVVLFELLTGISPYPTTSLTGLLRAILEQSPPSLLELRPDLPCGLARVVDKALRKDRHERHANGAELAAELATLGGQLDALDVGSDDERFSELRSCPFFGDFPDHELWEVLRACRWQRQTGGDEIIVEGHLGNAFYVLVSGTVAVRKGGAEITRLAPGDCFGEMGYLAKTSRSASIIAREDVVLLEVSAAAMERASLGCQLRFNRHFLSTLVERLARTSAALSER